MDQKGLWRLTQYRDYWLGILIITFTHSALGAIFEKNQLESIVIATGLGLLFLFILNSLISGLIFLISWVFKRNLHYDRFMKILVAWTVISLLAKILSLMNQAT